VFGPKERSPAKRYVPNIRANRAPTIVGPEFLNRALRWHRAARPGPSFRSQESGLRSLRCARLDEKDGTNSVNPKWPEPVLGGPLKC
jgi:hypothetical protein